MSLDRNDPAGTDLASEVLEHLPVAVVVVDREWRITYASPEAARLLRRKHGDMIGRAIPDVFAGAAESSIMAEARHAMAHRRPVALPDHKTADGRTLEVIAAPFREGLVASIRDVTELRRAESQLRASEERYRTLLTVAQEGVWVVDHHGTTTYVNDRMAEMLGYPPEELMGRSFMDFIEPERRSRARGVFARHRRGERTRIEARMVRKDSSFLYCIVAVQPLTDTSGRFQGALALITDIGDRVEAEAALKASEQRYRALANAAPMPVVVHQDERVVYANKAALEFIGARSFDDVKSWSPYQVLHPDDREHARKRAEQAIGRNKPNPPAEFRVLRLDGEVRYVESHNVPIEWEGRPAAQIVFIDTTEQKQALEALEASERRYRTLVDTSPAPMVVHREGRVLYANAAALELFGVERLEDGLGMPIFEFVHPDDHEIVRERMETILKTGGSLPVYVMRGVRADGQPLEIAVMSAPLTWEGEPALQTTMRDVTVQRRAVRALRERERDFRNLVEGSPVPMVVHREGLIVYANPVAARIAGASRPSELVGKRLFDLVHPDHRELAQERNRQVAEGEDVLPFEASVVTLQGHPVDVEITFIPVTFDGEPAVLLAARDIGAQRAGEQFQRDLMALVSHELRSPLAAMVGFATLLGREDVAADTALRESLVEKIQSRSDDMARLVDELMEGVRVDSGEFELDIQGCDIRVLLREVVAEAEVPDEVKVRVRVASGMPPLKCDRERIKRVFANLVSNAVKYSPDGGVVRVSARRAKDGVEIRVSDEGRGIPEGHLPRLFERFSRVPGKPVRGRKGFGMGLFIAQRVVQAHGGSIHAKSAPGKGTAFTVQLPG